MATVENNIVLVCYLLASDLQSYPITHAISSRLLKRSNSRFFFFFPTSVWRFTFNEQLCMTTLSYKKKYYKKEIDIHMFMTLLIQILENLFRH